MHSDNFEIQSPIVLDFAFVYPISNIDNNNNNNNNNNNDDDDDDDDDKIKRNDFNDTFVICHTFVRIAASL